MKKLTPAFLTSLGVLLMAASLVACDDHCDIALEEADQVGYRNPETGVCQAIGGGTGSPGCGDFGGGNDREQAPGAQPDMAICFGGCEGLDEETCLATDTCRGIYINRAYADCWGTAPSGPAPNLDCEGLDAYSCSRTDHCVATHTDNNGFPGDFLSCGDEAATPDVGSCVGEPACDVPEPECPAGTIAGRTPDCWTNYCIPIDQCDVTPACTSLDEVDCNASADCAGLYRGDDCSCDAVACSCTTYTYEGCGSNQP